MQVGPAQHIYIFGTFADHTSVDGLAICQCRIVDVHGSVILVRRQPRLTSGSFNLRSCSCEITHR